VETAYFVLFVRIDSTESVERLHVHGSGRRRSVRTRSNIKLVSDLIRSQEGQPGTSKSHERDWNFTFFSCENCQDSKE